MLTDLQRDMVSVGYVVSPNNIHSLPGVVMYTGGPCVLAPKRDCQIQVDDKTIRVFRVARFVGEPYEKGGKWEIEPVVSFTDATDFIEWCKVNGQVSEGGQPPNVWD